MPFFPIAPGAKAMVSRSKPSRTVPLQHSHDDGRTLQTGAMNLAYLSPPLLEWQAERPAKINKNVRLRMAVRNYPLKLLTNKKGCV